MASGMPKPNGSDENTKQAITGNLVELFKLPTSFDQLAAGPLGVHGSATALGEGLLEAGDLFPEVRLLVWEFCDEIILRCYQSLDGFAISVWRKDFALKLEIFQSGGVDWRERDTAGFAMGMRQVLIFVARVLYLTLRKVELEAFKHALLSNKVASDTDAQPAFAELFEAVLLARGKHEASKHLLNTLIAKHGHESVQRALAQMQEIVAHVSHRALGKTEYSRGGRLRDRLKPDERVG